MNSKQNCFNKKPRLTGLSSGARIQPTVLTHLESDLDTLGRRYRHLQAKPELYPPPGPTNTPYLVPLRSTPFEVLRRFRLGKVKPGDRHNMPPPIALRVSDTRGINDAIILNTPSGRSGLIHPEEKKRGAAAGV